jgi:DNA-binding MarR family transcriptional regulator
MAAKRVNSLQAKDLPGKNKPQHAVKKRGRTPQPEASKATVAFDEIIASWRRERPDLYLDDMLLAIGLARLSKMLDARFERLTQDRFGISSSDMRVLLALRRSGHPYARRPTDLFRALIVTSGAITKQVDRLAKKGLVARAPDPLHAGGYLVHLTLKGLKVVDAATEALATTSIIASGLRGLTEAEASNCFRFVQDLIREIERDNIT